MTRVDDLIIGGGAAGLTMACGLMRQSYKRSLFVLEPREAYQRDRTWCFWRLGTSWLDPLITHRWHRWQIAADGHPQLCHSQRYPYCHIPADGFYDHALHQLLRAPACTVLQGTHVTAVKPGTDGVEIQSSAGNFMAQRVFDSRPPVHSPPPQNTHRRHVELKQHFCGWHVQTKAACFNPKQVILMDFRRRSDDQIQFWYLLPFSAHEALIEATFISPQPMPPAAYQDELTRYMACTATDGQYTVLWQEQGCLSMSSKPPAKRTHSRIYRIGTAAGLLKPSSGYAMWAIQRHTTQLLADFAKRDFPHPPPARRRLLAMMDVIFLSVLQRYPQRAPGLFFALAQNVEPDALVRFLADEPTAGDLRAVISAMPKGLFARQACQTASLWLQH